MTRSHWLISISVLGLLVLVSSGLMISRLGDRELWGFLPLVQLTSSWLLILFLAAKKQLNRRDDLKLYSWASLSSVLLALGFPPFPFPWLLFIGFVPLLYVLDRAADWSRWQKFLLLYHTFILWNILSTYWVANTAYAAGLFAYIVNALLMCLPLLGYLYIRKHLGRAVGLMAFCCCWLAFEFLHMRWELYWPWLTLGNGLSGMHQAIQWYAYTGVFGGSFWILAANHLAFQWISAEKVRFQHVRLAFWILLPVLLSLIVYYRFTHNTSEAVQVVAVQPNFEPHYEKFEASPAAIMDTILFLARGKISDETDYLVLPETSFSRINLEDLIQGSDLEELRNLQEQFPNLKVIAGLGAFRLLTSSRDFSLPTTRHYTTSGHDVYYEEYNCAVQLNPNDTVQTYYKALFVPGAEFFPFQEVLYFMKPLVDHLGGTSFGYRTVERWGTFYSDLATVATPICYESIFGEFVNRFIKRGAQAIFVLTNDGWWDNTAGHQQHADYARLRAIETRRSVVRAANMGTTCFINAKGDMTQPTKYGEADAITGSVQLSNEITFYVKWGDVIGRVSLFIASLLLLRVFVLQILQRS